MAKTKKVKITKEMIASYIKSKGKKCPFCRSKDIGRFAINDRDDADTVNVLGDIEERVYCSKCSCIWVDVFKFSRIYLTSGIVVKPIPGSMQMIVKSVPIKTK